MDDLELSKLEKDVVSECETEVSGMKRESRLSCDELYTYVIIRNRDPGSIFENTLSSSLFLEPEQQDQMQKIRNARAQMPETTVSIMT